jgi:hypothetical protein
MILTKMHLARLLAFLATRDAELGPASRPARCAHCGGPMHAAHYLRRPWGWPHPEIAFDPETEPVKRWSWCCGRRGCRKRLTPSSWVFSGRRFYVAPLVLILAGLATGAAVQVQDVTSPQRRTISRWVLWWQDVFARGRAWTDLSGRMMCHGALSHLPGGLTAFVPTWSAWRVVLTGLRLMRPWTGGNSTM